MTPKIVLNLDNVSYSYSDNWSFNKRNGVSNISFQIFEGESFGFIGHNGAGKTTTIKCILGLVHHTKGQIQIFSLPNTDLSHRQYVGYLPEQPYFYDYLTVKEILYMYASLSGVPKAKLSEAVQSVVNLVKITPKINAQMRSLSKGLTQRVALAQAIVARPKLLILDEPFSGLDPIGRREFREILLDLKKSGTAILMCSHVLSDVEFLCDRVGIMSGGKLKGVFDIKTTDAFGAGVYELTIKDFAGRELVKLAKRHLVSEDSRGKHLKLIFTDQKEAQSALASAVSSGATVECFEFIHGNLEDLFVKIVNFEEAGK